jgi:hypothetical protein
MTGDDHLLAAFDDPDQLSETIPGFRGTDIHAFIIAIIYSQGNRSYGASELLRMSAAAPSGLIPSPAERPGPCGEFPPSGAQRK